MRVCSFSTARLFPLHVSFADAAISKVLCHQQENGVLGNQSDTSKNIMQLLPFMSMLVHCDQYNQMFLPTDPFLTTWDPPGSRATLQAVGFQSF